ncbi:MULTISPECIES: hypothetical protein [Paenibacillus]|nr:hypothetical protein [Paenibacillus massiliensis]
MEVTYAIDVELESSYCLLGQVRAGNTYVLRAASIVKLADGRMHKGGGA